MYVFIYLFTLTLTEVACAFQRIDTKQISVPRGQGNHCSVEFNVLYRVSHEIIMQPFTRPHCVI